MSFFIRGLSALAEADKAAERVDFILAVWSYLADNELADSGFSAGNAVSKTKLSEKLFHHCTSLMYAAMRSAVSLTSSRSMTSTGVCIFLSGIETVQVSAPPRLTE